MDSAYRLNMRTYCMLKINVTMALTKTIQYKEDGVDSCRDAGFLHKEKRHKPNSEELRVTFPMS